MSQGTLQNQKYQTCIDVCKGCAEASEYCATCDLQEQDVKAMASSSRLIGTVPIFVGQLYNSCQEIVNTQQICNICADICEACAKECERYTDNGPLSKLCTGM